MLGKFKTKYLRYISWGKNFQSDKNKKNFRMFFKKLENYDDKEGIGAELSFHLRMEYGIPLVFVSQQSFYLLFKFSYLKTLDLSLKFHTRNSTVIKKKMEF